MIDYYNLLKISPEASPAQVKKAFRRLAKQVHPDANPGGTPQEKEALRRRFIQLAQAYDVLSDPGRRAQYRRQWEARRGKAAGENPRSQRPERPAGAGPFRSSGATFGGARRAPGQDSPGRENTKGEPQFQMPEDLLDDVKNLLARFGLDLKHPLELLMERLTAWAQEIFQGVMDGMKPEAADEQARPKKNRPKPQQGTPAGATGSPRIGCLWESRGYCQCLSLSSWRPQFCPTIPRADRGSGWETR